MTKILSLIIPLVLVASLMTLTGCADQSGDKVSGTGTIKFIELEGGFYGIIGDNGKNYDPLNLNEEFQEDGLRIRFQGEIREGGILLHAWGTLIEITKIEKLR